MNTMTVHRDSRGSTRCGLLRLLLSLWCTRAADAEANIAMDTTLGNERATLSDGGAFSRTGESFRRSYCTPYHDMIANATDDKVLRNALSGHEVTVFLQAGIFFRYDAETGIDPVYPGVHARLLDHIAARGNFTWRQSFGVGVRGNRTVTELLDWGTAKYDVMAGMYTPSTTRMNRGVAFVEGHFDGSLIIVRNVEPVTRTSINWWSFLTPFEPPVWAAFFGVVVLSTCAYQLIETVGGKGVAYHQGKSRRVWFMENIYLSFLNFTGHYNFAPLTLGGRIFGMSFAFWAMLVTAAYTANLASILVSQTVSDLRVADIEDVILQQLPTCVQAGSFAEQFLRENHPGIVPYLVPLASREELFDELNTGGCEVMIFSKQQFETIVKMRSGNPKCTLTRQGRTIRHLVDGFATRIDPGVLCTDLVEAVFNYHMKDMKDNEFLDEYWTEHNNYYGDAGHCDASTDGANDAAGNLRRLVSGMGVSSKGKQSSGNLTGEKGALSLKDMAGTMLFQIIGSAVALVVAIISGFEPNTKNKRKNRREGATSGTNARIGDELESSNRNAVSTHARPVRKVLAAGSWSESGIRIQGQDAQEVAQKMNAHMAVVQHLNDRLSNGEGESQAQLRELNQQIDHLMFTTGQMQGTLGREEEEKTDLRSLLNSAKEDGVGINGLQGTLAVAASVQGRRVTG